MPQECSVCKKVSSKSCQSCLARFYCSKDCQIADWKEHKLVCPKVKERQISVVKGRGLVATRKITVGQTVLEDSPVMLIKKCRRMDKKILEEHKKLPKEQKTKYGMLSYIERPGLKKILNIFFSNAVSTQVCQEDENLEGVYYQVALINHSCSPNSVINITSERKIKIVALESIMRGEEVTLNYLPPSNGLAEPLRKFKRLPTLQSDFQFSCDCKVCSLTGHQLEENERSKILLTDQVKKIQTQYRHDAKNALVSQMEITKIMYSLGTEMKRDYYRSLQKCYLLAKILTLEGVALTAGYEPANYKNAAREAAFGLGESYMRQYEHWDRIYDRIIRQKTKQLVKKRSQLLNID